MTRRSHGQSIDAADVARQERALLGQLPAGASASAVVGTAAWIWGCRAGRPTTAAFGRQTVAWAVVDAAIALVGRRGLAHLSAADPEAAADAAQRRARRMRTITAVNAVADVGYVAGGAVLVRHARTSARRGDGAAIVVQGLFLLWLDVRHARRFHALG